MLPGEILALPGLDKAGYQRMLDWVTAGAQHGTLGGKVPNEAAVRRVDTPWGENKWFDAAGNEVSLYRDARAGEVSPYGVLGSGPSAPGPPAVVPQGPSLVGGGSIQPILRALQDSQAGPAAGLEHPVFASPEFGAFVEMLKRRVGRRTSLALPPR